MDYRALQRRGGGIALPAPIKVVVYPDEVEFRLLNDVRSPAVLIKDVVKVDLEGGSLRREGSCFRSSDRVGRLTVRFKDGRVASQNDVYHVTVKGGRYPTNQDLALSTRRPLLGGDTETAVALGTALTVTSLGGIGITIALLAKAKWAWAAVNFFVFTPLALLAVGGTVAGIVIASKKGSR